MKFLVDNQLPLALVRFLSERGFECRHVIELGLAQESDISIWRYTVEHEMVIISKDEDFFHLAGQPGAAAQFVWVRMGNCRKDVLLSKFDKAWSFVERCLTAGDPIVEIR